MSLSGIDLSQEALGNKICLSEPNVARILSGRSGKIPDSIQRILETLDLELVAISMQEAQQRFGQEM